MIYLLFALLVSVPTSLRAVHAHTVLRPKFGAEHRGSGVSFRTALLPVPQCAVWRRNHQTVHFLVGFMGAPVGQLNSWANSGVFDMGPMTL